MNIENLNKSGVSDCYLELTTFMNNFVNKNYPLNDSDLLSIINGNLTEKVKKRIDAIKILKMEINKIIEQEIKDNDQFLLNLNEGNDVSAKEIVFYKKQFYKYKEQMLEALWNYEHFISPETDNSMSNSKKI